MPTFLPTPFRRRETVLLVLAITMAIGSVFWCWSAGISGGGAWSFSVVVGTIVFLVVGRQHRVFLTGVFCFVLYLGLGIAKLWHQIQHRKRFLVPDAQEVIAFLFLFIFGVVAPVGIAWIVSRLTANETTAS